MTRRQRARERRAYNRIRHLWPEALRRFRWPLTEDENYEAHEEMDLPQRMKWRTRAESRRVDRLRLEQENREWRRQYDRENFAMSVIGGWRWEMRQE